MTTTPVLKTAVLGLGRIAWRFHIPQILSHPGFTLAAVMDPLEERRCEAAETFRPGACFASCDELYARLMPDLVVVASPTQFHKQQVLQAFEHGCDVFCDKPLALSLSETDEIIEAMHRSGRKLMVYQPHRVTQEAAAIKAILSSGMLGTIHLIRHSVVDFKRQSDWQAFRKNGGGMLNNYGAHFIDQLLYLNQSNFRKINCELRAVVTLGDADDVVKIVMTAVNGVILDLDINMAGAQGVSPWYIAGSCGAAVFDPERQEWTLRYFEPGELARLNPQEGLAAANRAYGSGETIPWKTKIICNHDFAEIDFFAKCWDYFAGGALPLVPVGETREVMRAIAECRRDAGW
ncbi:MAG: Gfo/Idh/MocA family oxidoreductase [bacterium]